MNSANLEQYFGEKEIEFTPTVRKDYCFTMNMLPGCRFRSCSARLSESEDSAQLQLSVEMPLMVNPNEYAGLSIHLAGLNERIADQYGDQFSEIASELREGLILDVVGGAVCYKLRIRRNPSCEFGAEQVRLMVEGIAGGSIYQYAEDIMRMISRESMTVEIKQCCAEARAADEDEYESLEEFPPFDEIDVLPRSHSLFERFMEFIGVISPSDTK